MFNSYADNISPSLDLVYDDDNFLLNTGLVMTHHAPHTCTEKHVMTNHHATCTKWADHDTSEILFELFLRNFQSKTRIN